MYKIVTFLFCLVAFVTPAGDIHPVGASIQIENESIYGVSLPDWALTCQDANIYDYPGSNIVGTLPQGTRVRIREGSKNNEYAMLRAGAWVKTTDLCRDE